MVAKSRSRAKRLWSKLRCRIPIEASSQTTPSLMLTIADEILSIRMTLKKLNRLCKKQNQFCEITPRTTQHIPRIVSRSELFERWDEECDEDADFLEIRRVDPFQRVRRR